MLISSVNFEVPVFKCLCVKKASFFPCFLMMFFGSCCPASAVMRLYSDLFSEYILVMKYLDLAVLLVILYVILTIYFGIDCHITGICLKDSFGDKKIGFCRVFFLYINVFIVIADGFLKSGPCCFACSFQLSS